MEPASQVRVRAVHGFLRGEVLSRERGLCPTLDSAWRPRVHGLVCCWDVVVWSTEWLALINGLTGTRPSFLLQLEVEGEPTGFGSPPR